MVLSRIAVLISSSSEYSLPEWLSPSLLVCRSSLPSIATVAQEQSLEVARGGSVATMLSTTADSLECNIHHRRDGTFYELSAMDMRLPVGNQQIVKFSSYMKHHCWINLQHHVDIYIVFNDVQKLIDCMSMKCDKPLSMRGRTMAQPTKASTINSILAHKSGNKLDAQITLRLGWIPRPLRPSLPWLTST